MTEMKENKEKEWKNIGRQHINEGRKKKNNENIKEIKMVGRKRKKWGRKIKKMIWNNNTINKKIYTSSDVISMTPNTKDNEDFSCLC